MGGISDSRPGTLEPETLSRIRCGPGPVEGNIYRYRRLPNSRSPRLSRRERSGVRMAGTGAPTTRPRLGKHEGRSVSGQPPRRSALAGIPAHYGHGGGPTKVTRLRPAAPRLRADTQG